MTPSSRLCVLVATAVLALLKLSTSPLWAEEAPNGDAAEQHGSQVPEKTIFAFILNVDGHQVLAEAVEVAADSASEGQITVRVADGSLNAIIGFNPTGERGRIESVLRHKVRHVAVACSLSELQKQKLQLAGQGDIARMFHELEDLQRESRMAVSADNAETKLKAQIIHVFRRAGPLRNLFDKPDPFDEASFFRKALNKTLTPDQLAAYACCEFLHAWGRFIGALRLPGWLRELVGCEPQPEFSMQRRVDSIHTHRARHLA